MSHLKEFFNKFQGTQIIDDTLVYKGAKECLEALQKDIEEWRIQLEDVGFVTIDKRFVNELINLIEEAMK